MSIKKQKRVVAQKLYHNGTGKFKDTAHIGWQLPADAASYAAMVEQMAEGMHRGVNGRPHTIAWRYLDTEDAFRIAYTNGARNALAAIGIKEASK